MQNDVEIIVDPKSKEPRISDETLCRLFDDVNKFDDLVIIDCRSYLEYYAGHIKTAIRCHPTEANDNILNLYKRIWKPRVCFVFHCEFSKYRGPTAYRLFAQAHHNSTNADQTLNAFRWRVLSFFCFTPRLLCWHICTRNRSSTRMINKNVVFMQ